MIKKWHGVMMIGLALVLMLTAAACGGDDKKEDPKDAPGTNLSQSLDSSSGISVKYPEDWFAAEAEGMVQIATGEDVLSAETIEKGQMGIIIFPPDMVASLGGGETASPTDVLTSFSQMMAGEGEFGEVSEIKIGGHEAARMNAGDDSTEGFMTALKVNDDQIVIANVVTAKDDLGNHESTALDILATISYTAPEE